MQPCSDVQIPDGLLAEMTLLSEKPRLGFRAGKCTVHQGLEAAKYLNRIGDTTTLVRYSWQVSLKAQQIASTINNFNNIVSQRVDSILDAYKSGHYVLSEQEASLAGIATNPAGSDSLQQGQVAAGARSTLFSIEAKQLGEQVQGQVTSFLASASRDEKLNFLGELSHGSYLDAPRGVAKGAAAAGSFALGHIPIVGGVMDWMASHTWNPQASARDDATKRTNQSLGSN